MDDRVIEDLAAWLPALLRSLEDLRVIARHLHPPELREVLDAVGPSDAALGMACSGLRNWPDSVGQIRARLDSASEAVLGAFKGLRLAAERPNGIRDAYRALLRVSEAQEILYPLAAALPQIDQFFLEPGHRDDPAVLSRQSELGGGAASGVMHFDNEPGSRGGFSLYVPEFYTPDHSWPLVMALHGGSGHGRAFLWTWLRSARSHGAIVIAPTAVGGTWALMGDDVDTPNLSRMLDLVHGRWNVDPARRLLTGMSDGGTFCYASGLDAESQFTHLAPVAASFHPLLAQFADGDRMRDLPIYIVHGALDWMFSVEVARQARRSLMAAGAHVMYRELDDLSHCYPIEINAELLAWLSFSE